MTSDGASRFLIAAGTQNYSELGSLAKLDSVPADLLAIVELFTSPETGYLEALSGLRHDPKSQQFEDDVERWLTASERLATDIVVVYYSGHGEVVDDSFYLLTADTTDGHYVRTAVDSSNIVKWLRESSPVRRIMIIIDACYSGRAAQKIVEATLRNTKRLEFSGRGEGLWVLAASRPREEARESVFTPAFASAVRHWQQNAESIQPYLALEDIYGILNEELGENQQPYATNVGAAGLAPFFPNPRYIAGVAGRTMAEQYWLSRARGIPNDSTAGGFYLTGSTGRVKVLTDLARWMRGPDRYGAAVVTGSPGSGKSAMLALPVLLADATNRDALIAGTVADSLVIKAAELFAGLPVVGIYARDMDPNQVASAIAKHLGLTAGRPEILLDDLEDLEDRSELSGRVFAIDAIDEARDPPKMLKDLLLPLGCQPGLKVVVGIRRLPPDLPPDAKPSLVIDLDSDDYQDPQALAEYARQLLIAAHEPDVASPYRDRHDDPENLAGTVAAKIAQKATERSSETRQAESFLVAQLLARAVRGRGHALDVTRTNWTRQLPADAGTAFDEDLRQLGGREPVARALMTALAWAKGPGLPRKTIWVPVARALVTVAGHGKLRVDLSDVRWLLDNTSAYVVEDLGPDDRPVFRLSHNLLAAHLRGKLSRTPDQRRQAEEAIYYALLHTVPGGRTLQDWDNADPYLRTYLAQYAATAGTPILAELAKNIEFLATADPVPLGALLSPAVPELRDAARTYRRVRPMLGQDVYANAAHIQAASRTQMGAATATENNVRVVFPHTHTRSALRDDSSAVLTGHGAPVNSVAFGTTTLGQPLLASASDDHTVRLWDPIDGSPIGKPLTGHHDGVSSVAFGTTTCGEPLLASASWDGTIRLWNPDNGDSMGKPLTGHRGGISSVAFGTTTRGQALLVSAGDDQTVRLWNPNNGDPIGKPLTGHHGWVGALAFGTTTGGRSLLASAGNDQTVRLWITDDDAPTGEPLTGHTGWISALAFALGEPLLASASSDGTVRLWITDDDAPTGEPLTGHTGWISALAFALGEPLLASASSDGTVRLWNLDDNAPTGEPLTGHTGGVSAVAFGRIDGGQLLLASGGDDQTVRLWDLTSGALSGRGGWLSLLTSRGMATGQPVLASAS
jgi:WD40 repeat protein